MSLPLFPDEIAHLLAELQLGDQEKHDYLMSLQDLPDQQDILDRIAALYVPPMASDGEMRAAIEEALLSRLRPSPGVMVTSAGLQVDSSELLQSGARTRKGLELVVGDLNHQLQRLRAKQQPILAGLYNNLACAHAWLFEFSPASRWSQHAVEAADSEKRAWLEDNWRLIQLAQARWQSHKDPGK